MLPTKLKSRRVTQACDFCHSRGLRCKAQIPNEALSCLTCVEYGQQCTRKRQPRRRGTKPRAGGRVTLQRDFVLPGPGAGDSVMVKSSSLLVERHMITLFLDVYLDSIHPNFPLFCERELWVGWRDGSFPADDSDFMSLRCLCALSAQHVGDGALFSTNIDAPERNNLRETYIAEATRPVPVDFEKADLDLVRSYTFLALLGAQTGNNAMLHKYLGLCHGVCAELNLHDEARWPVTITACEREVRRRLWWSIYRLEVHTACVLGNIVRSSETRCGVCYPSGAHHPAFIPGRNGQYEAWFDGWNTTTDLYRVLEHAISDLRAKHRPEQSILGRMSSPDPAAIMTRLSQIQECLLPQFVTPASRSDDNGRNRCGFQAPNIICTIHLARLLSCISGDDNPLLACKVADDLVNSITAIPPEYIRATGSPLIQQLAGVGHILVGIAKKHQLPQEHYEQMKHVIYSIIGLLERPTGQNTIAMTAKTRLAALLADVDGLYATNHNWSTAVDDFSPEESMNPAPQQELDISGDVDGEATAFSNDLLTDFTWLYLTF